MHRGLATSVRLLASMAVTPAHIYQMISLSAAQLLDTATIAEAAEPVAIGI